MELKNSSLDVTLLVTISGDALKVEQGLKHNFTMWAAIHLCISLSAYYDIDHTAAREARPHGLVLTSNDTLHADFALWLP